MTTFTKYFIKYRSFIGIIALIIVLFLSKPDANSIAIGFFLIIIGIIFRGWSSGYLKKNRELATKGPYALTRNPLYFSNLILGTGIVIASNSLYGYLIFVIYYLSFFPALILIENKKLRKLFGSEYENWAKNKNTFFPKIKKIDLNGFNISYYMKNREYKTLYFSLFIVLVLIFKAILSL